MPIHAVFLSTALLLGALLCVTSVSAEESQQPLLAPSEVRGAVAALGVWQPLRDRLAAEGISGADVDDFFVRLSQTPSQDPMGRKVRELYRRNFMRQPPDPNAPKQPRPLYYKGVVTEENALLCREFLAANRDVLTTVETRYGVPKHIAVALMFVETRLGTMLGAESAFYTLASMAATTTPEDIPLWLDKLPGYEEHLDWMRELMPKRAEWAYKELRALVAYAQAQNIDPFTMPGSIYGAIGICQFMPSNLVPYGADGDGDGVVDLFTVPDAAASLSNYLVKHGWKPGIPRARQHALLKTYNKVDIYANTILALADLIVGQSPAVSTPKPGKRSGK